MGTLGASVVPLIEPFAGLKLIPVGRCPPLAPNQLPDDATCRENVVSPTLPVTVGCITNSWPRGISNFGAVETWIGVQASIESVNWFVVVVTLDGVR